MCDIMDNMFVEIHPAKAKQTVFRDGNFFLIASTGSVYSL